MYRPVVFRHRQLQGALKSLLSSSFATSSCADLPVAHVLPGKARLFQEGNPILFGGVVKKLSENPSPMAGHEILVADHHGNAIGKGVYNPYSLYRVRMLALQTEAGFAIPLTDLIKDRIESAYMMRKNGIMIPNADTTAYRLINSEGDRLSGLIVDVFGEIVVAQSAALWIEMNKQNIIDALKHVLGNHCHVVWRQSTNFLKLDGYVAEAVPSATDDSELVAQKFPDGTNVLEEGIKYHVRPGSGQKTGFYCDQRKNRLMLRPLCSGKKVLDLCCFSGGFSLNALHGGCTSVIGVDSSEGAINTATINMTLNRELDSAKCSFVKSDAIEYMKECVLRGEEYDVIILDPPKLAPNAKALEKATKKYITMNSLAMQLLNKKNGGLLFTCSCSAAMVQSPGKFQSVVSSAARRVGRTAQILSTQTAAEDHPVLSNYSETKYLTGLLLHIV